MFNDGKVAYTYDATGTKLSKIVEPYSGTTVTTDYLGGFQYEDNDLQFFFQPEGYVKKDNNNYLYVFQYKDHLGNVRLSYADCNNDGIIQSSSEILEENNYYPFGLKHQGYNELASDVHKYKFLNREYQPELGLNTIATDYRHYDSALGRFNNMDALSELAYNQTPCRYGFNNPVYWTDPTGLFETRQLAASYARNSLFMANPFDYIIYGNDEWGYELYVLGGVFAGQTFYDGDSVEVLQELVITNDSSGGAGGRNGDSSSKPKTPSLWDRLGWGGMFNVWGVMGDAPTPKERGRNTAEFSMDFDQVRGGSVSLRTKNDWWKNLKEWLSGMDSRTKTASSNSRVGDQTKQTSIEAHQEKTTEFLRIWYMNKDMFDRSHEATRRASKLIEIPISQVEHYRKLNEEDSTYHAQKRR